MCKSAVDVGFLLDASGSLINHFDEEKKFLSEITGAFHISRDGSRASVIRFSYWANLDIKVRNCLLFIVCLSSIHYSLLIHLLTYLFA